ncbi:MAG: tRNA adenosine(34) deaminase TadA [Acidobacteriota bacterium]
MSTDETFMDRALALGREAADGGEVPVGAVAVLDGEMIGEGTNRSIRTCDPSAHAEIVALRAAARHTGNYRLPGLTLYVVVEPCLMCVGALLHARIRRLVYGATDPKVGSIALARELAARHAVNHSFEVTAGVRAAGCRQLLTGYFHTRRRADIDV